MSNGENMPNTVKKIGSVYLHISNSGVEFKVIDEGFGPTIVVESSALGNIQSSIKTFTDTYSLKQLGEMLIKASEQEYSKDYIHKAC